MAERDIIIMSVKELKRLRVVQEAIAKHITQKAAAEVIGISERHMRRIVRSMRQGGEKALVHKSRGRRSNNLISEETKAEAIKA